MRRRHTMQEAMEHCRLACRARRHTRDAGPPLHAPLVYCRVMWQCTAPCSGDITPEHPIAACIAASFLGCR
jgi:hypothetical protein